MEGEAMASRKPKYFSYIRFSSSAQASSDSYRRQIKMSDEWAKRNEVRIEELRFQDLGISAFRLKNKEHALGEFLAAVEKGKVQSGDYLLVESIDRISRAKPLDAFDLFKSIIRAGVTVVTLMDGMEYTERSLNEDNGQIYILLGSIQRAHNESQTKSDRVAESWDEKRRLAQQGVRTKHKCPAWLMWDETKREFKPIQDRAEAVKLIYSLYLQGYGQKSIVTYLREHGIKCFGNKDSWRNPYVQKILRSKTPIGVVEFRNPQTDEVIEVEGYYPQLVKPLDWERARSRRERNSWNGATKHSFGESLFTKLAYCGYCGSTMRRTHAQKTLVSGKKKRYYYLTCSESRDCVCELSWLYNSSEGFEHTFLTFVRDSLDFSVLNISDSADSEHHILSVRKATLSRQIAEVEEKIRNWAESLAICPEASRKRLVEFMEEAEAEIRSLSDELTRVTQQLESVLFSRTTGKQILSNLKELSQSIQTGETAERGRMRSQLRFHLGEIIEKVSLFPGGPAPLTDADVESSIESELTSLRMIGMQEARLSQAREQLRQTYTGFQRNWTPEKHARYFIVHFRSGQVRLVRRRFDTDEYIAAQDHTGQRYSVQTEQGDGSILVSDIDLSDTERIQYSRHVEQGRSGAVSPGGPPQRETGCAQQDPRSRAGIRQRPKAIREREKQLLAFRNDFRHRHGIPSKGPIPYEFKAKLREELTDHFDGEGS